MDNNKQSSEYKPATPATPAMPQQPTSAAPKTGGPSKMIFVLIGAVVLIMLIFGGIYWYLNKQQAASQSIAPVVNTQTTKADENLDQSLNSIDVQAADSDFTSIDQDLQSL